MQKRNTVRGVVVAIALAGLAWPAAQAFAQTAAYTSSPVDLYAGPSGDYPVVSEIGPGAPVTVMGCVSDYSWCDVALPGLRGWVYANYLTYPYEGQYVPLQGYGAAIGLPIIGFSIGTYWDSFYRNRPWYGEREHWARVPSPGYGARPPGPRSGVRQPEGGRPFPPAARASEPGRPGGNFGQQRPVQPEGAPRPAAQQPGGARPGAPAGGVEHGASPMRGAGPVPGRPAAPSQGGGHPSGEGGGHQEDRQPGQ